MSFENFVDGMAAVYNHVYEIAQVGGNPIASSAYYGGFVIL